jgi:hypothetical protein
VGSAPLGGVGGTTGVGVVGAVGGLVGVTGAGGVVESDGGAVTGAVVGADWLAT